MISRVLADFLNDHVAVARDTNDIVSVDWLERAFVKWCARTGHRVPSPSSNGRPWSVFAAMRRIKWPGVETVRGERHDLFYYARWVEPVAPVELEEQERHLPERSAPEVIRQLRTKESLTFVDHAVAEGALVDQMRPSKWEQRVLEELLEREVKHYKDGARPWIIISVGGRRRTVRSSAFVKVDS